MEENVEENEELLYRIENVKNRYRKIEN